jgi:hypothetical protein
MIDAPTIITVPQNVAPQIRYGETLQTPEGYLIRKLYAAPVVFGQPYPAATPAPPRGYAYGSESQYKFVF